MRVHRLQSLIVSIVASISIAPALAEDLGWPRRFESAGNQVVVFQPQVDSWEKHDTLRFRMAASVQQAGSEHRDYGVIDVTADTKINHEDRAVLLTNIRSDVRFRDLSEEMAARLVSIVRNALPNRQTIVVDFDRLLAYIEVSDVTPREVKVNLEPPPIVYSDRPAILVNFMGEPKLKSIEGTKLLFAANTNWDVFFEMGASRYFLRVDDGWLTSSDVKSSGGAWQPATRLPADLSKLPDSENWAEVKKHVPGKPISNPPAVFVSAQPTELIVTEGEPLLSPIQGTDLLYISNTESDLFLHTKDRQYYLLVAGRWFRAKQLTGPWSAATLDLPDTVQRGIVYVGDGDHHHRTDQQRTNELPGDAPTQDGPPPLNVLGRSLPKTAHSPLPGALCLLEKRLFSSRVRPRDQSNTEHDHSDK